MDSTFSAILNKHENEDFKQASEQSRFISAIEREFSNSGEILAAAQSLNISARDFIDGKITDFPIIPIRKSDRFYLKKHTSSQMPYFHGHSFYELIYVHRGRCVQKFKDGSIIRLTEKQCALLRPQSVHKIEKCEKTDIILKAVIPRSMFEETGKVVFGEMPAADVNVYRATATAEFALLKLLAQQLRKNKNSALIIKSYLTILFAELAYPQEADVAMEELLNDYFDKNIVAANLAEFAALHNYNANYASRLIKTRTGKTFSRLLSEYRMSKAKNLLSESSLSVEAVAASVGYLNTSGFYKQFCSVFGMTPSEYRKLF